MATKGTKNKKIEQTEVKTVLDSVKDLNLAKAVNEVSNLQVNIQNMLAGLSSSLTSKIQNLEQINTAINIKEQRLQELYGIENMAITLDDMKAQKEADEQLYDEQKALRAKAWMDEESERHKKCKREHEEYEYARNLQQKKCRDEFDAEVVISKRNEQARQEMLTKSWTDRESALKSKENEFIILQKQVSEFDTRLKTEVNKAETVVANTLKKDFTHQFELLKKDAEAQNTLANMKLAGQEKAVQDLYSQIKSLETQLAAARMDAREVASEALKSASGRQVAEALQRVVDTREPNMKK